MNLIFDNGKDKFSLEDYDTYGEFLEAILPTVKEKDDILKEYTIELDYVNSSDFDINFNSAGSVETLWDWFSKVNDYDGLDQEVILAYASLHVVSLSEITEALDNYIGWAEDDYEMATDILYNYHDFSRDQIHYILDTLDCTEKILEYTESWASYYFWL